MTTTNNLDTSKYAQMGMAALLPGMVHMLAVMTEMVETFRLQLAAAQGLEFRNPEPARGVGQPRKDSPRVAAGGNAWAGMTAEERSREMKRRMAVAKRRKAGLAKPPATTVLSESRKKEWAAMSPAKKKKRLRAMLQGRTRKAAAKLQEAA